MKSISIESWTNDIETYLKKLKEKIDKNEISKSLYGGFYVWDSKYIVNPEIMFLGINPGNGNPNNSGQIVVNPEPQISYMEYFDGENPNYRLAKETVDVFEMAGFSLDEIEILLNDKSIKTNFYYLITRNQVDIKKCIDQLNNYSFSDYWKQSYTWTGELIELTNPKVIICEGKNIFDTVIDYDEYTEKKWEDGCGYIIRPNGKVIIGYSRIFSNIKNKNGLSMLIKKFLKD